MNNTENDKAVDVPGQIVVEAVMNILREYNIKSTLADEYEGHLDKIYDSINDMMNNLRSNATDADKLAQIEKDMSVIDEYYTDIRIQQQAAADIRNEGR